MLKRITVKYTYTTLFLTAIMSNTIITNNEDQQIDYSGERVRSYAHLINLCDEVQFGLRSFLTGYNQ